VLTGTVAALNAGPAVVLSFVLAGVASIFAALCYSEFASLVPMAGSAYTYGYATLGELFAWIIGWDLVLEYALGAVTVAIGWSGYVVSSCTTSAWTCPPPSRPPGHAAHPHPRPGLEGGDRRAVANRDRPRDRPEHPAARDGGVQSPGHHHHRHHHPRCS